ncbi:MAG TPA: prolyl oligopeptidase family serine peptidase [Nocardioidaceae bacterium]|nr:prolyl oligopeptidase family serine peptidase [Nocardioidaceae bacterium]
MSPGQPHSSAYPHARSDDIVDDLHGERVADPYRWLEDADSAETKTWQAAQDELFANARDSWPTREHFAKRIAELMRTGAVGTPVWRGERAFYLRREPDQEHGVLLTLDPDGTERTLVDPMAIDPSGVTTLDAWQPSKDGRLLAYQISTGGTEAADLQLLDVESGDPVDQPIDRCRHSPVAWLPDSSAFYYVRQLPLDDLPEDERQYHRRVWLHRLGTDPADDPIVYGDDLDKTAFYGVSVSLDGRWLTVSTTLGTAPRNDVWLADLTAGPLETPELRPVITGADARTGIWIGRDGRMYVHTDRDAPRGRLLVGDPTDPGPDTWQELIPEDPEAVLNDAAVLDDAATPDDRGEPLLVCSWTRHAVAEISVHDLVTGDRRGAIELPGLGTVGGLVERPEGGHEIWFGYSDHVTPGLVLHYDARTGETSTWAVPPGVVPDTSDIEVRQVAYDSYDGTTVRMFVLSRRGVEGPRPTILYGYGGFGISLTPGYASTVQAWLEAGGSYAIANLRGGGEEGEAWHRAGRREHKQRVFDDFHAAAERLINDGVTDASRLAIMGGSNGGLLVGAALTQRPDLFRAVVCSAPLLDMVRYELHGFGALWSDDYGTASDPEQLRWLLAYSPYHRVQSGTAYPAVLFTVYASDSRVDPLHARKLCAALQAASASDPATHPILIRLETEVGHAGRSVSRAVGNSADSLAFVAWATGVTPATEGSQVPVGEAAEG